jgi:hypothetical protein
MMPDERIFNKREKYQIVIKGHLDPKWANWFDGFLIAPDPIGRTTLTGTVKDQAALHGLLTKIRDLGLFLLSVNWIGSGEDKLQLDDLTKYFD